MSSATPDRTSLVVGRARDPAPVGLAFLLLALLAGFGLVLGGRFLNLSNLQSLAFQLPELGILSLAMMLPMLCGGINLAVIAQANLAGIVMAKLATGWAPAGLAGDPAAVVELAVLVGISASAAVGWLNGVLIARVGVSPILATLGTMTLVGGINVLITNGKAVSGLPRAMQAVGQATVFGLPVPLIVFALAAASIAILLARTRFGLNVYLIGSNERAARFSGIDTRRALVTVYVLSGALCGTAGLIMAGRFNSANAGYGESYLLVTILAAVLGGVDPDGGFGRISNLVVALLVLQVTSTGLNGLGLNGFATLVIWGLLLIVSVTFRASQAQGRGLMRLFGRRT